MLRINSKVHCQPSLALETKEPREPKFQGQTLTLSLLHTTRLLDGLLRSSTISGSQTAIGTLNDTVTTVVLTVEQIASLTTIANTQAFCAVIEYMETRQWANCSSYLSSLSQSITSSLSNGILLNTTNTISI